MPGGKTHESMRDIVVAVPPPLDSKLLGNVDGDAANRIDQPFRPRKSTWAQ